jgi:hypothetical protein
MLTAKGRKALTAETGGRDRRAAAIRRILEA